jgi:PAS domain S-box-containing protein
MDSSVNQAAILAKHRVAATAVSIYEHWRDEETFHLTGCVGGDPNVPGPASQLKRQERQTGDPWTGLTSFVAFNKEPLSLPLSSDGYNTLLDGQPIHVSMDAASCEIANPGPFLAVPILDPYGNQKPALGVIRAIRRLGLQPFTEDDKERLVWVARFLALSFIEERMRVDLIDGLMSIVTCDTESDVLERIAAEATRLLTHPTAVFLQDPVQQDRYVFRAPLEIENRISQKEYTRESGGFTPLVLFGGLSYVVSPNLTVDTAPGGPLHGVGHEPKAAELGTAQSQSFVAVPIPGATKDDKVKGAIRASAPERYAISHRDAETLRALARQATVVLQKQEEKRDRDSLFQSIVDTSARPIIAVDSKQQITVCNDAMATLLGISKHEALNRKLLDVVYAGKTKLARANHAALDASNGKLRGHFTTIYRRSPSGGWLTIPVLIDMSYLRSSLPSQTTGAVAYVEDLRGSGFEDRIVTVIGSPDQNGVTRELITVDRDTVKELQRFQQDVKRDTDGIILISGETGVGKETLAEAAAVALGRPTVVTVNCAGLEEGVLESELFGAEKGQATGVEGHDGLFKKHPDSTFILDEIQELTPRAQAKLLRVLDTGRIRAVGKKEEAVNIRVVALTNADIDKEEEQLRFRRDLKHRLEGMTFRLKPLRERRADIMQLADYFLERLRRAAPHGPEGFSSDCINAFLNYHWPGNVRQLQHAVALAFRRSADAEPPQLVVQFAALPERIQRASGPTRFELAATSERRHEPDQNLTDLREQLVDLQSRISTLEARPAAGQLRRPDKSYEEALVEAITADSDLPYRVLRGARKESEQVLSAVFQEKGWLSPERSMYFGLQKVLYTSILEQKVLAIPHLRLDLSKGGRKALTSFFERLGVRPPKNSEFYLTLLRSPDFGKVRTGLA